MATTRWVTAGLSVWATAATTGLVLVAVNVAQPSVVAPPPIVVTVAPPTPPQRPPARTVSWFKTNRGELQRVMVQCKNNPGEAMRNDDCINASHAWNSP